MSRGEAIVSVTPSSECPLLEVSNHIDGDVDLISWSANLSDDEGGMVENFTLGINGSKKELTRKPSKEMLVSQYDISHEIQFNSQQIESFHSIIESVIGQEVSKIRLRDDHIEVHFDVENSVEISTILDELKQKYQQVSLVKTSGGDEGGSRRRINLSGLTPKQRKVLEKAFEMGYFKYPKESNATEVAEELGISRSTLSEHLSAAQMKIGNQVFDI